MLIHHARQRALLAIVVLSLPLLTACGQTTAAQAPIPTAVPIRTQVTLPTQVPTAEPDPTAKPTDEPSDQAPNPTSAPTQPPAPPAVPPADAASARLQVPPGFAVRIYAQLDNPRLMTVGPDGQLYVAERGARAVVRLPDRNNDGLADAREVVAEGLGGVHNVEWFAGSLYAADASQVTRLTDANNDGDMLDAGEQAFVVALPTGGNHSSRTLHFGPDGMLYVSAGSTGNIEKETDLRRGTIMRYAPDGSIPADNPFANDPDPTLQPVWAEGLRNSVDFLFLPDGRLWANHNGSDGLGDELPPEEIVIQVERGRHYGWPACYTPVLGAVPPGTQDVRDERVNNGRLTDCAQSVPALFTDLAHQAPLGMAQYRATAFPPLYQNNLFVAYHGSWNSGNPRDCRVQMIVVRDGLPVEAQPFLTGFRDSEQQECGAAWGRPAGIAVGANGELFVSDDQNGLIYRVVYVE